MTQREPRVPPEDDGRIHGASPSLDTRFFELLGERVPGIAYPDGMRISQRFSVMADVK
jgi:hypothetical protein